MMQGASGGGSNSVPSSMGASPVSLPAVRKGRFSVVTHPDMAALNTPESLSAKANDIGSQQLESTFLSLSPEQCLPRNQFINFGR